MPAARLVEWGDVAAATADGLAVVDGAGRFVQLNPAAVALCGARRETDLIGAPAPFALTQEPTACPGLLEDQPDEQVVHWVTGSGTRREFAYRARNLPAGPSLKVVSFRDVTDEGHRYRRVAAIARTSVSLASEGSLGSTLDAVARQIVRTDGLAGVQILILDSTGRELRLMGSAGLRRSDTFLDRLLECRDRGARLVMLDTLKEREPIVVPHRWAEIRSDPAWEPLHDYLGELAWDSFVSVPLTVRGRAEGVLNAYFAPGQEVGTRTLEFLAAMAEQAALAVDHATLLQRERDGARQDERQRLARDLHDSIVQQVFSIGMQANAVGVLGTRGAPVPAEAVRHFADEIGTLSRTVLADLRAMVHELRPSSTADLGLEETVHTLVRSTENRTGLDFRLRFGRGLDSIDPELAEDAYRIVAEAIHNVVKHAEATLATVRIGVHGHTLTASVTDNGRGLRDASESPVPPEGDRSVGARGDGEGYGLTTMRERAERWGGTMRMRSRARRGTTVRVVVPLPVRVPDPSPEDPDNSANIPLTVRL
ncbi:MULTISPECIES: sensor histidine kinase [Streptomyces]|uniref:Oxygen sensor histidine kinase NreB n=1 Tax=Streptomyces stelliscabiei TaxID=146820 RepID=A0A8I0NZ97_9ACTN|nr:MULTISPECIES: GAF domain-containing sensor histidine kinase [Streptomyces]MBE1595270.1 signal transduction histidine kinase [Streptomyces stelliscabiei]MDX2516226.1 GAF domain-containing sensor histidine kinase [Streptomyces stelliscabiei]MDX2553197.1 GAF domain-containing sensor histidine kinase [Streptomyces stelliscabiei]MDX2612185.1 GAF domain-containing sensor histidine kinase [Streptomyces stelliscabiei]MDX2636523.1 GAF domain-containing sensor histidine kinase [Streptomyces stellisca